MNIRVPNKITKQQYEEGSRWVLITTLKMGLKITPDLEWKDVHSFGMIGYLRAIESYNSTKGKWMGYALNMIRWTILMFINRNSFVSTQNKNADPAEFCEFRDYMLTSDADQDQIAAENELKEKCIEACKALQTCTYEVAKQYFIEGKSFVDIGKDQGKSKQRIHQQISRAKKEMKLVMFQYLTEYLEAS